MLRRHQQQLDQLSKDIADGVITTNKILCYVTPGGGKSDLPAILAKNLAERLDYRILWVVPRDALRRQGEVSFVDRDTRARIGHRSELRAADNKTPLVRSNAIGYITTYQAIAANPQMHRDEMELAKHRGIKYILFLDECHHVAAPNEYVEDPEERAYYKAIAPLVEIADLLVLATGTLERHDKAKIAFLPYIGAAGGEWVDLKSREMFVIRYTRKDGLEERAILPLHMAYADGAAIWTDSDGQELSVESIAEMDRKSQAAALRTVLETEYAYVLLDKCIDSWRQYKQQVFAGAKMLVIAPSQKIAREYNDYINSIGMNSVAALSEDGPDAQKAIGRFKAKGHSSVDILVSVAIAYEGLDVKQISHVTLMTKYRSRPWIEQAISRANRVADNKTHGYIYAPDDPALRKILDEIEKEQQGVVVQPIPSPNAINGTSGTRVNIVPLGSELTRSRSHGMDDGTETTYAEDEMLESVMRECGLIGSTIQGKQMLLLLGLADLIHVNGEINSNKATISLPISVREAQLRKNINAYINSFYRGDSEAVKVIRTAAYSQFGPIDKLGYDELRQQWAWLQQEHPGGVITSDAN